MQYEHQLEAYMNEKQMLQWSILQDSEDETYLDSNTEEYYNPSLETY